jgi:hypothetical protein
MTDTAKTAYSFTVPRDQVAIVTTLLQDIHTLSIEAFAFFRDPQERFKNACAVVQEADPIGSNSILYDFVAKAGYDDLHQNTTLTFGDAIDAPVAAYTRWTRDNKTGLWMEHEKSFFHHGKFCVAPLDETGTYPCESNAHFNNDSSLGNGKWIWADGSELDIDVGSRLAGHVDIDIEKAPFMPGHDLGVTDLEISVGRWDFGRIKEATGEKGVCFPKKVVRTLNDKMTEMRENIGYSHKFSEPGLIDLMKAPPLDRMNALLHPLGVTSSVPKSYTGEELQSYLNALTPEKELGGAVRVPVLTLAPR